MLLKKISLLFFVCTVVFSAFGQERFTLSGNITDAENGEGLIGATVLIKELNTGGVANEYGFYSVTLPKGTYTVVISYVGFESISQEIDLSQNQRLNFELTSQSGSLEEVVVTSDRPDENVRSTSIGVNKLDVREIEVVPVVFGERDVIKTIQLLAIQIARKV